jgi:peptidoglycan/LPS O-acetylase OafA/YrhL
VDKALSKKLGILRFAAVETVVVFHAYPPGWHGGFTQELVSLGSTRWALPFLGLISGFLFFRTFTPTVGGYLAKLCTRARTILLPFLVWSAVALLVAWASGSPAFHGPVTSPADALYMWLVKPAAAPLWFLQALMVCILLSPLVYLAVRVLRWWVLVVAVAWWATGFQPEALDSWVSPVAFPPFIAGAAVAMLKPRLSWARRPAPAWALAAAAGGWIAAAALFAAFGPDVGRLARAVMLPAVVLGALTVWLGYEALRRPLRRAPGLVAAAVYVAPLSFFVYVTQQPQLRAVMLVLDQRFTGLPEVVDYALAPLATIACSLLVAVAWRRVSPRTFTMVSGGRAGAGGRAAGRNGRAAERSGRAAGAALPAETSAAGAAIALEPSAVGNAAS